MCNIIVLPIYLQTTPMASWDCRHPLFQYFRVMIAGWQTQMILFWALKLMKLTMIKFKWPSNWMKEQCIVPAASMSSIFVSRTNPPWIISDNMWCTWCNNSVSVNYSRSTRLLAHLVEMKYEIEFTHILKCSIQRLNKHLNKSNPNPRAHIQRDLPGSDPGHLIHFLHRQPQRQNIASHNSYIQPSTSHLPPIHSRNRSCFS